MIAAGKTTPDGQLEVDGATIQNVSKMLRSVSAIDILVLYFVIMICSNEHFFTFWSVFDNLIIFHRWSSTDWLSIKSRTIWELFSRSMTELDHSRLSSFRRLRTYTQRPLRTINTNLKYGSELWEPWVFSNRLLLLLEILSSKWYNMTRLPIISFKYLSLIILERREFLAQHNLNHNLDRQIPAPVVHKNLLMTFR